MIEKLNISYDSELLESISASFDLRAPNKEALRKLIFTLEGEYDSDVMQVLDLATGVGKTYLMAAFIEYLRQQGIKNVMIVTPGKVVQAKTIQNFTPGSPRYIEGSIVPPDVVTPQDYGQWIARNNGTERIAFGRETPILAFIFNIQQLIAPRRQEGETHGASADAVRRRPRRFDESAGVLFDYLRDADDLVVIADESHLYSESAAAFSSALRELAPAACIGLTASASESDNVIYRYPLYRAIEDQYVKAPVLAFRKEGYGEDAKSEEQQLRDALSLRAIKQAYYDSYTKKHGLPHLNAIAFIVCSDMEHANQVADLLKTSEYLGSEWAVLQVDSNHDDETTQRRLENLDDPNSQVLAVVSVNKLKEGWDVKNISVIVTLRAMASEVLTQQTMGRGLRLPFGRYTGIFQVDQLDIISHQSFKELLDNENVLRQFGLENAVPEHNQGNVADSIKSALEAAEGQERGGMQPVEFDLDETTVSLDDFGALQTDDSILLNGSYLSDNEGNRPGIGVKTLHELQGEAPSLELVTIEPNPRFENASYDFPVTTIEIKQPPIDLSEIEDVTLEAAARKVTSAGDMLYRKEIVAKLGRELRVVDTEGAEVESARITEEAARSTLIKLVLDMQLVPKTPGAIGNVKSYLVPKFMHAAPVEYWTVKSLGSACSLLREVINEHIGETLRGTREVPVVNPKPMRPTGYTLNLGEKVYDQVDSRESFVPRRVYGGWFKSWVEAESFDSYTGEYELAKLLNTSPNIVWWQRLHPGEGAFIYFNSKDRYFPDFVALDDEGVHWIIEGKSARGRDDQVVQDKRHAAESLVRRLTAEDAFSGQHWGYLIAYEDDIAKSDSWSDLKALAQPVSNKVD